MSFIESETVQKTDSKYSESLDGDKITISAEGEYVSGTCEFVLDGDNITSSFDSEDMFGPGMFIYMCRAVGDYLGIRRQSTANGGGVKN